MTFFVILICNEGISSRLVLEALYAVLAITAVDLVTYLSESVYITCMLPE